MTDSPNEAANQASIQSNTKSLVLPPELENHPQYKVLRRIGKGGMGVLYLVEHKVTHRCEALKIIHPHLLSKPGVRERFLREIQTAARLNHPNVVRTLTAISEENLLGLVMEYAPGETLQRLVYRVGPLQVERALDFIAQAAEGLAHAHEEGMVHRDIKPANLMITQTSDRLRLRILDFGLAKSNFETEEDRQLTRSDSIVGTPEYIAPEQALNPTKADIRADIYSLGCCLYYSLTGHVPFEGETTLAVLHAHLVGDYKPMKHWREDLPDIVVQLQQIMMNREPEKRFQNPKALLSAIRKCYRAFMLQTQAKSKPEPQSAVEDTVIHDSTSDSSVVEPVVGPMSGGPLNSIERAVLSQTPQTAFETGSPSSDLSASSSIAAKGADSETSSTNIQSPVSSQANASEPGETTIEISPQSPEPGRQSDSQSSFVIRPKSTKSKIVSEPKPVKRQTAKDKQDKMLILGATGALVLILLLFAVWWMIPRKDPTAKVLVSKIPSDVEIFINNQKVEWKQAATSTKFVAEVKPGMVVFSYRRNGKEFRKHQLRMAVDDEYELKPDFSESPFGSSESAEKEGHNQSTGKSEENPAIDNPKS